MTEPADFVGSKAALVCDGQILTYLRDDRPGLPWPGCWDLPGGGREGSETAEQCLFREVAEEFGLTLTVGHLVWRGVFPAMAEPGRQALFFAGRISRADICAIRFGQEGQSWCMMPLADWLRHPRAIPDLQSRTRTALTACAVDQPA